jgi:glycosyltransferase involved in cell wall biosynthesis
MAKKSLSIIVTAYNSQNYIEECLNSINEQTYFKNFDDYEILLGIDACESTLKEVLKIKDKYKNLRVFMMNKNKGTYITSNTLINISQYENILRFDSDDIMLPNMVENLMENEGDIISMKYFCFGRHDGIMGNFFTEGVILYTREVINKIKGYRPWLCAADSEFLLRASKNGFKKNYLNKTLFNRRIHNNSLTQNQKTGRNSELRQQYIKEIIKYKNMDFKDIPFEFVINNYKEY